MKKLLFLFSLLLMIGFTAESQQLFKGNLRIKGYLIVDDSTQTPRIILTSSSLPANARAGTIVLYNDTLRQKSVSGWLKLGSAGGSSNPKGINGDIQLNYNGQFGVIKNIISTGGIFRFNSTGVYIGDTIDYYDYIDWKWGSSGYLDWTGRTATTNANIGFNKTGDCWMRSYASNTYGGLIKVQGGSTNTYIILEIVTDLGSNQLNINKYGCYINNSDPANWGAITASNKYLTTKKYVDGYYSGNLTDGIPTAAEINSATSLTPSTAGTNRKLLIKDTNGTGLYYDVISDGSNWIYFPGKTGTTAL